MKTKVLAPTTEAARSNFHKNAGHVSESLLLSAFALGRKMRRIVPYYTPQWDSRWQGLYRAAIFGQNLSSADRLIAQAEAAIAMRNNELAQRSDPWADPEREGMEDALYALKALRTAQPA